MATAPVKTVLFDMGNVVVTFSHERMCCQIAEVCDLPVDEVRRLLFLSGVQWEFEKGMVSESDVHALLERAAMRSIDFPSLIRAGSDIFTLNPGIPEILTWLKAAGLRLVLLSNTSISHFRFVRDNFPVMAWFDEFVVSYAVGQLKPHPAIYQAALNAIECPPENCLYTDDIAEYVAAGRSHGLQAEVFTTPKALVEQLHARGVQLNG